IIELLARLGSELEIGPLHDGVHRTGLLAQAAIDALHHVDVVAGGAAGAVIAARPGLDGDGLGRADRLAQLAGDTAFLPVGIAAQRMLAAEAGRDRVLLERIVDGGLGLEEIAHGQAESLHELLEEDRSRRLVEPHWSTPILPPCGRTSSRRRKTPRCRSRARCAASARSCARTPAARTRSASGRASSGSLPRPR